MMDNCIGRSFLHSYWPQVNNAKVWRPDLNKTPVWFCGRQCIDVFSYIVSSRLVVGVLCNMTWGRGINFFRGLACISLVTLFFILVGVNYLPKFTKLMYSASTNSIFKAISTLPTVNPSHLKDFDGFDNQTGANKFIVPNIVHYIRLNKKSWTFVEYICLRSVYVNQRPDFIFIHTNILNGFKGKYWKWIQEEVDLKSRLIAVPVQLPSEVFGQKFNPNWRIHHGSDVIRIQALMKYGGIFLDNDVYVVHNLDKYRKFEMTLGWPKNESLGNMVLFANKKARFLRLWRDNYRDYHADKWYGICISSYFLYTSWYNMHSIF